MSIPLYGQPPITFTQFGTNGHDIALSLSATASAVYVGGYTGGALPGQTNAGQDDAFLRKYDRNGVELWTRQFGTSAVDIVHAVTAVEGSVYVVGSTDGALPGQTNAGNYDAFVRKYGADGTVLWTRQFGTSALDAILAGSVVADKGSVYVAGWTEGTLPGQTNTGRGDVFVRKYTATGVELWTRQFGSSEADYGLGMDATAQDGVYIVGETLGILPGQGGAGGQGDAFIRKYDADGNEVWTRQFGTSTPDSSASVTATGNGVYVAGNTYGTFPGQTNAGVQDAFVRKYDTDGTVLWTRQFGSSDLDACHSVSVVADGGVYITGITYGTLPGQSSAGGVDGFVYKYDANGIHRWVAQFGTSETDVSQSASAIFRYDF